MLSSTDCSAEIDTGIAGAVVSLRVDRFEDRRAVNSLDLSNYITPGQETIPPVRWDPRDGCAFTIDEPQGATEPRFLLVDALLFGPWIYRLEAALPLRRMPKDSAAAGRLLKIEPIPTLRDAVLREAVLDIVPVSASPLPLGANPERVRARCFEMVLPEGWLCEPSRFGAADTSFDLLAPEPLAGCRFEIDPRWLDLGQGAGRRHGPDRLAKVSAARLKRDHDGGPADLPDAARRPRGAPTVCRWRPGEAFVKLRESYLDEGHREPVRIDSEYGVRKRPHGSGLQLVHCHIRAPQECRLDAGFQAAANRVWLSFLEGRFLDGD